MSYARESAAISPRGKRCISFPKATCKEVCLIALILSLCGVSSVYAQGYTTEEVGSEPEEMRAGYAGVSTDEELPVGLSLDQQDDGSVQPTLDSRSSKIQLEEVIVTARKREERTQDVPETIQSFSSGKLGSAGVETAKDLPRLTPNFQLVETLQPGSILINIRGVGQLRNGEAPIAYVVDGVQSSISNQITQTLFDVERIEVLKGPQGAVYGRNAIGGAVSVVTKKPTNEFAGKIEGKVGNGEDYKVGLQLSGPIVEDVALIRVAGQFRDFRGLIFGENIQPKPDYVDDVETVSGRLNLLLYPSDRLSLSLIGGYDDIEAGAAYYVPYSLVRDIGRGPNRDISEPRPVTMDKKGLGLRTIEDYSLKAEYDFDAGVLTSVTAQTTLDSFLAEDLDWLPAPLLSANQTVENKALSQELRFVSAGGGPLQYLGGLYYLEQELVRDTVVYVGDVGNIDLGIVDPLIDFLLNLPVVPVVFDEKGSSEDIRLYAAFGQVEYDITTFLTGSLGMRYDVDEREQYDRVTGEFNDATFTSLQPKVTLSYDVASKLKLQSFDILNAYGSVGKGFRSGGFNPTDQVGRKYEKEELINYELGVKSRFNGWLDVNAAAFYMDVSDRQVYTLDLLTVSQLIANPIPKASIFGLELEMGAAIHEKLFIGLGLGYLTSEILDYDTSVYQGTVAAGDFEGNQLNQTPEYSYNFTFDYTQPIGEMELILHGDVYGSAGDYYWEINNVDLRDSQVFVNLSLTLRTAQWSVGAYVENATDERYVEEFVPYEFSGGLADIGLPSRPRRYGMKFSLEF